MKKFFGLLLISFFIQSCYYDKEEILYPEVTNNCDTVNVYYSTNISQIISSSCLTCHSNTSANTLGGGIPLESYSDVKKNVDNGKFLGTIIHDTGYSPMPKGANKLNDCNISQIKIWINLGAENN